MGETLGTLQHFIQSFFQYLGIQQLFAVFPFIDGFGFVETFITLQPDERQREHFGGGFG